MRRLRKRPPQQNLWVTFHASRPFGIGFVAGNKADSASGGFVATGFILSARLTRVSLRIAVRGKEPQEGGPGEPAAPVPPEFDPRILPKSQKENNLPVGRPFQAAKGVLDVDVAAQFAGPTTVRELADRVGDLALLCVGRDLLEAFFQFTRLAALVPELAENRFECRDRRLRSRGGVRPAARTEIHRGNGANDEPPTLPPSPNRRSPRGHSGLPGPPDSRKKVCLSRRGRSRTSPAAWAG